MPCSAGEHLQLGFRRRLLPTWVRCLAVGATRTEVDPGAVAEAVIVQPAAEIVFGNRALGRCDQRCGHDKGADSD